MNGPAPPSSIAKEAWEAYATRIIGGLSLIVLGLGTVVYRIFEDWSCISDRVSEG